MALLFLPLPFLLWAAVRFGALGASTGISIVGFLAIWSASHGHGPFSSGTAEQNALSIQIFLIGLAIPLLFLAAGDRGARNWRDRVLRESESRFQIVADAAPVLIWMSGVDKLCTFFNKPWLEFTGRSMEQELGNGWAEGVHRDDLQKCLQVYTSAFDARQPFVMQYRLRRHDGEYRWISDQGVPRYDAQGKFAGYIGSCVDVTELMTKDEALRESEERMRLSQQTRLIWEFGNGTSQRMRSGLLTHAEPSWAGQLQETSLFEDFISRVHPEDRSRIRQTISDAIRDAKDYESEYRLVLPDGIVRWMSTRGSVHFDDGGKTRTNFGNQHRHHSAQTSRTRCAARSRRAISSQSRSVDG